MMERRKSPQLFKFLIRDNINGTVLISYFSTILDIEFNN